MLKKLEFVRDSVRETVSPDVVECILINDMERFSNGFLPFGYELASFTHNDKKGSVTGAGASIAVSVNGRTWQVPLSHIIAVAIEADNQREAAIAKATQDGAQ